MTYISELERNNDQFTEFNTFWETIARKSKHIAHTDEKQHFVKYNIMELHSAKMDGLRSPYLGLETPRLVTQNNTGANTLGNWRGAIVIGHEYEPDNSKDREAAMSKCWYIFVKVLAILLHYRMNGKLIDFDLDNINAVPVVEMFGNKVGVRWEFSMPTQLDLNVYDQDWDDLDGAIPMPPFITIYINGQPVELTREDDGYVINTDAVGTTSTINGENTGETTPDGGTTEFSVVLNDGVTPAGGVVDGLSFILNAFPEPSGTTSTINGQDTGETTEDGGVTAMRVLKNDGVTPADGTVDGLDFIQDPIPSMLVELDEDNPTIGDTVEITATVSGLSPAPTNYMFFVSSGSSITFLASQAGNTFNWDTDLAGEMDVHVIADNGTTQIVDCAGIEVDGINFTHTTEFNGSTQYVTVATDPLLEFGTTARSYSIWVKPDTISGNHGIIDNLDAGSPFDGFMLLQLGANLQVYASGGSAIINHSGYFTGEVGNWIHITVTRSAAGTWKLYKNGVYVTQATDTDDTDTGLSYVFGKRGSWYWDGKMGLGIFCNKELSAAEITELYNGQEMIDPRLLSFWGDVVAALPGGSDDVSPTWAELKNGLDGTMVNMDETNFVEDVP